MTDDAEPTFEPALDADLDPYLDRNPGPDPGPDDETAALLRGVLQRRAEAVRPSGDGLVRILAAAHAGSTVPDPRVRPGAPRPGPPRSAPPRTGGAGPIPIARRPLVIDGPADRQRPLVRWMPVLSAAAAVAIVCVGLGLARLGMIQGPGLDAVVGGPAAPSTGLTHPPAADPLPVYLVERQNARWALVREFSPTTLTDPGARVTAAVRLAVAGTGLDADHTSVWRAQQVDVGAATRIVVTRDGDTLVVRLPAALLGSAPDDAADAPPARLAVQQLVWTVTAAARDTTPVRIDGPAPGSTLFGTYHLGQRVGRDRTDPVAPVWVSSLVDGQRLVAGHAVIQGDAVAGAGGTVAWRLVDAGGTQIADGAAPLRREAGGAPRVGERGVWEVTLQLPSPGTYRFEVRQAWPAAHAGDAPAATSVDWVDTKTLVVS